MNVSCFFTAETFRPCSSCGNLQDHFTASLSTQCHANKRRDNNLGAAHLSSKRKQLADDEHQEHILYLPLDDFCIDMPDDGLRKGLKHVRRS
jgi:hypothetical protein